MNGNPYNENTSTDGFSFSVAAHVFGSDAYESVTNATATINEETVTPFRGGIRLQTTTRTGYPCTENLYDDLGDPVGAVVSGITNRTYVSYETVADEVWRVAESLAGAARSITRERLTGLSDTLRRHTVAIGATGVTNEMSAVWNESARTLTETQTSSLRATPSSPAAAPMQSLHTPSTHLAAKPSVSMPWATP